MIDTKAVGNALDRLMLAKNKPLLSPEAKLVWIELLKDESMDAIGFAIDLLMRTPNQFPEAANVIENCKKRMNDKKRALESADGNVQCAIEAFKREVAMGDIVHAQRSWDYINKYPELRDKYNFKDVRP